MTVHTRTDLAVCLPYNLRLLIEFNTVKYKVMVFLNLLKGANVITKTGSTASSSLLLSM